MSDRADEAVLNTAGIDLAASAPGTALAIIEWGEWGARLSSVDVGVSDGEIVTAVAYCAMVGIDCALGWPDDFVEFVGRHARGERVDQSQDEGIAWRRRLAYRETDRDIHARTGKLPLSVAADRLGLTAMHCAVLLDLLGEQRGGAVDRSGRAGVVEVYPAATLRVWGFERRGYKKDAGVRDALLAAIEAGAPWLDLGVHRERLLASDDAFDAFIAALAARAHERGLTPPIPREHEDRASREGWIAVPEGRLADLGPARPVVRGL